MTQKSITARLIPVAAASLIVFGAVGCSSAVNSEQRPFAPSSATATAAATPSAPERKAAPPPQGGEEIYYRTMDPRDYEKLKSNRKVPATSETCISPSRKYSAQYDGTLVGFTLKPGLTSKLIKIGVRQDQPQTQSSYPNMPLVYKGWVHEAALFKFEQGQMNICLGKGPALDTFNKDIVSYSKLQK